MWQARTAHPPERPWSPRIVVPTPQVHGFAELDRADRTPAELAAFLQVIRAILLDQSPHLSQR